MRMNVEQLKREIDIGWREVKIEKAKKGIKSEKGKRDRDKEKESKKGVRESEEGRVKRNIWRE